MNSTVSAPLAGDARPASAQVTDDPPFAARHGWTRHPIDGGAAWLRGHLHSHTLRGVAAALPGLVATGDAALIRFFDGLDGHFSLVATGPGWKLAASDPVRSFPLLWARTGAGIAVDHDGPRLAARLGLGVDDIDPQMAAAFALSGFTIGDATLYAPVRQVGPGQLLLARGAEARLLRYHRWRPWQPEQTAYADLVEPLSAGHRTLIEALAASAKGRPILVPLSAGLDSRFVVSGLVEAGYPDVRCFSYGLPGNRDAVAAREVARRLGVPWSFVAYDNRAIAAMFRSADYRAFMAYSDSLTSIHFPQEYFALDALRRRVELPDDAILVNGQSGDFTAGNHIPPALRSVPRGLDPEGRRRGVVDALLAKHFKHWRALLTPERLASISSLLEAEIDAIGGMPDDPRGDHGIYEYCEFQDRQSKYVINGQRLYEFFGLDWRLPLWERAYLDFWETAPLEAKAQEQLYRDVLMRDNWGNVWQDVPVNAIRVRPSWLVPIRLLAKALHTPLGKDRWHRFEKRFFDYALATTCAYALVPYWRVARDRRGYHSAIGWHIEDYLAGKGLMWDGSPARR